MNSFELFRECEISIFNQRFDFKFIQLKSNYSGNIYKTETSPGLIIFEKK